MGIAEILDEHGLEFLGCGGSKECDSSAVTSSDSFGSYSTRTTAACTTPTPTQRRGVRKIPSKLVATVSASDTKRQKDNTTGSIDAKGEKMAKSAIQQHRQRVLNRQRQQESLVLDDEDDDIFIGSKKSGCRNVSPVQEPFLVPDTSRIETLEDSLLGWPSESGCWRGSGENGVSPPPPGSPELDSSSKEKLASITVLVMNGTPADKENVGGSSTSTSTATGSLSSPDSNSDIGLSVQ